MKTSDPSAWPLRTEGLSWSSEEKGAVIVGTVTQYTSRLCFCPLCPAGLWLCASLLFSPLPFLDIHDNYLGPAARMQNTYANEVLDINIKPQQKKSSFLKKFFKSNRNSWTNTDMCSSQVENISNRKVEKKNTWHIYFFRYLRRRRYGLNQSYMWSPALRLNLQEYFIAATFRRWTFIGQTSVRPSSGRRPA